MELTALVSISYDDVFDDFETVDIKKAISAIPTDNAIEILCYFQAQIHTNLDNLSIQILLTKMWAMRFPDDIIKKIEAFINKHSTEKNKFVLINNASCLDLIQYIFESNNQLPVQSDLTPEQELLLFKAYLYFTKKWIDKQILPKEKIKNEYDLLQIILPNQLPFVEIMDVKDFRLQFIKAIYFFRFCENDEIFSTLLKSFLENRNVENWQEYIFHILKSYARDLTPGKTPSILNIEGDYQEVKDWIETLCIDISDFKSTADFKTIREKPIYKLRDNSYAFLNLNFFIDKIFQGIRFDFAKSIIEAKVEVNGKKISNFGDFNSLYSSSFSEKVLFSNVITRSFSKLKYNLLNEDELNEYFNEGAPDFYIRDKAKIYLFEFKDITLNADIKHSYDFEIIKNELIKKFCENQEGKPKGINQLIEVLKRIASGELNKLIPDIKEDLIFYPIIVYTDYSLNAKGIEYLLNKEFNQEIAEKHELKSLNIKDLVLIDLDSFVKFQDLFRTKKIKINHCLNKHIEFTHEAKIYSKLTTFNQNIHYLTSKIKYEEIEMFKEEIHSIINKNIE